MKEILLALTILFSVARSQSAVKNVRIIGYTEYILRVIQETISEVEHREWCNLKMPDITKPIDETVIDRRYHGTVTYSNGFVVSINQIDVEQSSVQQLWSWNSDGTGAVSLRGTLRMTDLVIGYDVVADTDDGRHTYTATFRHPLISFAFDMNYNTHTEEIATTVVAIVPRITTIHPDFFPKDSTSSVLSVLFDPQDTAEGIQAWGPNVLQPICAGVVARVDFPRICYDCPITVTVI